MKRGAVVGVIVALIILVFVFLRDKHAVHKLMADAVWVSVSFAACAHWLNENQGVWGFCVAVAGVAISAVISIYFKRKALEEIRVANASGIKLADPTTAMDGD